MKIFLSMIETLSAKQQCKVIKVEKAVGSFDVLE